MKILNLYACLGGNRYKWNEVKEDIEVTAVELDPELARLYQERFPNDKVIIADAHQYLLEHYKEYDFIWSSPPCPTHSRIRHQKAHYHQNTDVNYAVVYSDMNLYQEIILLKHYFKGKFVIENVIPYYTPLIQAIKRGRHLYWTNFNLPNNLNERKLKVLAKKGHEYLDLLKFHEIDLSSYKGVQTKQKIARNLVDYEAGRTIFETMLGIVRKEDIKQTELF